MNDDLISLASAYLDGDVTPAERAQVEGSDELLAEVERLGQVRGVLGDHEPAPISTREDHLAAALAAWDRLPDVERIGAVRDQTPAGVDAAAAAAASTVSAPPPSSLAARRAHRNRGWMLAAAAGLVVVLGGGIVLNGLRDGGDDDQASSEPPAEEAPSSGRAQPASEAEDIAVEAGEVFAADDAPADTEAPADAPAAEPAPEADAAVEEAEPAPDLAEEAEAPPPEEDVISLATPDELADYASSSFDATTSGDTDGQPVETDAAPVPPDERVGFDVPQCDTIDIVVGPATFGGQSVVVGVDLDRGEAVANLVDSCAEVARVPLP